MAYIIDYIAWQYNEFYEESTNEWAPYKPVAFIWSKIDPRQCASVVCCCLLHTHARARHVYQQKKTGDVLIFWLDYIKNLQ